MKKIPLMKTEDGEIIYLPSSNKPLKIMLAGEVGMGMSSITERACSRLFDYGRVGWLVDPMNQFYDLSLPREVKGEQRTGMNVASLNIPKSYLTLKGKVK